MRLFSPLLCFAALAALLPASAEEPKLEPGAVSLFNGKDLTGWGYRHMPEKDREWHTNWKKRDPNAPDITRTGKTAGWSEADFFRALRQGTRPDGTTINGDMMPWARSGLMTDEEVQAVWRYISSLPGKPAAS